MIGRVLVASMGLWLASMHGVCRAAEPLGTFTIVEGEVALLRGDSQRLAVAPGVRLLADDIVDTSARTAVARLELRSGAALDLGPQTRLWFQPRSAAERGRTLDTYILEGWVKFSPPHAPSAGAPARTLASPLADLSGLTGVVLAHVSAQEMLVFVESGEARLVERRDGKPQPVMTVKAGEFYARKAADKGSVAPRPAASFLERMPRAFRDTLPDLAGRYKDRDVAGKPLPEPGYADVEGWLKGEPVVRRAALARWKGRAQEPEFRAALVANVKAHMEWDRVLFPEKYLPKPAVVPPAAPVTRP